MLILSFDNHSQVGATNLPNPNGLAGTTIPLARYQGALA